MYSKYRICDEFNLAGNFGMMQTILPLLVLAFTGLIAYTTIRFAALTMSYSGLGGVFEIKWMLDKTFAQASFFMFIIKTAVLASAVACLVKISNHGIITLDIIYFISLMMLILYHTLKKAGNSPIYE